MHVHVHVYMYARYNNRPDFQDPDRLKHLSISIGKNLKII